MATGASLYSGVSSLLNDIYEGAFHTLRQQNLLVPTVSNFTGDGLLARKVSTYDSVTVNTIGENDDMVAQQFDRTLLTTVSPTIRGAQIFLSDMRVASDDHNVRADASMELGAAFAQKVDEDIATNFSSLTGGTIGSAGATIDWADIIAARSIMAGLKVPAPYFCVLHPYQWDVLFRENTITAATGGFQRATAFQDRAVNNYFESPGLSGVTFVITPSIAIDGSDDAIGAMYSPMALMYDERRAFMIEAERDPSRGGGGWELNGSLVFGHGVWRPATGVQIISDASTPTG